jgi:SAM-dependent methyltransferase
VSYKKSAQYYDLFDHKNKIEFFYQYASRVSEALDVGAGTGRIAIPLAERRVKVCCVEPSPAMREEFEKKLIGHAELRERIQIIPSNAASFEIEKSFPMAFLSGSFDHFVTGGERKASLGNINRHLLPGGILVFDVFLGLMVNRPLSPAGETKIGSKRIRRLVGCQVLTPERLEVELVYEVYRSGEMVERIREIGLVGITSRQEVNRVLEEISFGVKKEWGGYEFKPFDEGDSMLIIEAVKVKSKEVNDGLHA